MTLVAEIICYSSSSHNNRDVLGFGFFGKCFMSCDLEIKMLYSELGEKISKSTTISHQGALNPSLHVFDDKL